MKKQSRTRVKNKYADPIALQDQLEKIGIDLRAQGHSLKDPNIVEYVLAPQRPTTLMQYDTSIKESKNDAYKRLHKLFTEGIKSHIKALQDLIEHLQAIIK